MRTHFVALGGFALAVVCAAALGIASDEESGEYGVLPPEKQGQPTSEGKVETPRFEDARIVVWPGEDRAYAGFTIIGKGDNLYATPSRISAVRPDGRSVEWNVQTSTGGPADVVAMEGRHANPPVGRDGGDGYYFDASQVKVGETIQVTFRFFLLTRPQAWDGSSSPLPGPVVEVPFKVIGAGDETGR